VTGAALACPDKFRGSLSAPAAAAAIARGLAQAGWEPVRALPLADGGEGTLDVLLSACGGRRRTATVTGPLGDPVAADWGRLPDGTAVVEMARASGLALTAGRNDPLRATTRGTGELIVAARAAGCRRIVVGVGGSATTDGGLGAVEALGWSLAGLEVTVACDVRTPFLDAARLYGPQKGATPAQVALLGRRLERLAELYERRTGVRVRDLPGSGAAGGLAGGLAALGARLAPGFEVVAEAVGLDDALAAARLVVTGEGRVDETSFAGKVVGEVLARVPTGIARGVVAGEVLPSARARLAEAGVEVEALRDAVDTPEEAFTRAEALATAAAATLGRRLSDGGGVRR
jgi:glycerate kinase